MYFPAFLVCSIQWHQKNFGPGHNRVVQSRPGSWPVTRDKKYVSRKAFHARNTTVGHLSKSVKYEPSYGHLNFHYSSVQLYIIKNFKLKNLFLGVDQKLSSKDGIAEWITSLFESVWIVRSNHVQGGYFFAFNYFPNH